MTPPRKSSWPVYTDEVSPCALRGAGLEVRNTYANSTCACARNPGHLTVIGGVVVSALACVFGGVICVADFGDIALLAWAYIYFCTPPQTCTLIPVYEHV